MAAGGPGGLHGRAALSAEVARLLFRGLWPRAKSATDNAARRDMHFS